MKLNLNLENIYVLPVEFIVTMKSGSGLALTLEDISNALKNLGYIVKPCMSILDNKKGRLFVIPPRHIITGEDMILETEEK